jgi:hypothetical protein
MVFSGLNVRFFKFFSLSLLGKLTIPWKSAYPLEVLVSWKTGCPFGKQIISWKTNYPSGKLVDPLVN